MSIDELFEVNEQILLAEDRLAEQTTRVGALELEGRDAAAARDKLLFLENGLSLLISRRKYAYAGGLATNPADRLQNRHAGD